MTKPSNAGGSCLIEISVFPKYVESRGLRWEVDPAVFLRQQIKAYTGRPAKEILLQEIRFREAIAKPISTKVPIPSKSAVPGSVTGVGTISPAR